MSTKRSLTFITERRREQPSGRADDCSRDVRAARLEGEPGILATAEAALAALEPRLREERDAIARAVGALMPAEPVLAPALVAQAGRNARARTEFLAQVPVLDAGQVAARAGSRARNRSALAARWRAEGRIFALPLGGRLLYPAFQFGADGRPLPVLAELLAETAGRLGMGPWALALWLGGRSGALGDRRPLDLLEAEPERVLAAAREIGAGGAW